MVRARDEEETMTGTTTKMLLAAGLAAGLLAAGCGDDDGEDAPTRSEYIASSNALCKESEATAEEAFGRIIGGDRPTPVKAQRFLKEGVIPAIRRNVAEREALTPPDGDEAEVEAMISAGEQAIAGLEQVAADREQVEALFRGKLRDPATEFDSLSGEYGIDQCSGGN
jgi:hypothetical protein